VSDQNRLRDIAVKYAHLMWVTDYSYLLKQADEIERLQARVDELEKGYVQLQKFVDAQAEDVALWGHAQYISEAYIQRGLRGCHAFIEQTIEALEGEEK